MTEPNIAATPHTFVIRTAPGWTDIAFDEATRILATPSHRYKFTPKLKLGKGRLLLSHCDLRQGLEVMLNLKTAFDFELTLIDADAPNWSALKNHLQRIPWAAIKASVNPSAQVSCKCADSFTDSSEGLEGAIRSSGQLAAKEDSSTLKLRARLRHNRLQIYVSLAGTPLYKRGYKSNVAHAAPLPEHVASSIIQWTIGRADAAAITQVYVPFAGSGTLGHEAVLALRAASPAIFARSYACELFPCMPLPTIAYLRKKTALSEAQKRPLTVACSDIDPVAVTTVQAISRQFPIFSDVQVQVGDFFDMPFVEEGDGRSLILLNPPYGIRLAQDMDVTAFFKSIGKRLLAWSKVLKPGSVGACICPTEASWKAFNKSLGQLKTETRHFTHGGMDLRVIRWNN